MRPGDRQGHVSIAAVTVGILSALPACPSTIADTAESRQLRPAEWMLLLMSSGDFGFELGQEGGRPLCEFGVGSDADLEPA